MFNLVGDGDGNLWVVVPDGAENPPEFEVDDDGNIFMMVSGLEKGVNA